MVCDNKWSIEPWDPHASTNITVSGYAEVTTVEDISFSDFEGWGITNLTARSSAPKYSVFYVINTNISGDPSSIRRDVSKFEDGLAYGKYLEHIFDGEWGSIANDFRKRQDVEYKLSGTVNGGNSSYTYIDYESFVSKTVYTSEEDVSMSTLVGYIIGGETNIVSELPEPHYFGPGVDCDYEGDEPDNGRFLNLETVRFVVIDAETPTIHH